MKIAGMQKLTLLDYPNKVACTIFTSNCNFRCPFCHNASIVSDSTSTISDSDVFRFLEKRVGLIDAVCISGGEPTLQIDLKGFIKGVKEAVINAKKDWSSWCKKDRDKLNFALYNLLSDSRVHSEEFFKNVDILWDLSMPKKIELEELIDVLINPSKYREDKKYENLVTLIIKGVLPGAMSSFELFNLLKNSIDISKIFADYCKSLREYCYELIDANEQ